MNPRNFFSELKRRNVYKVAVAYAVVGWLLIQVATQVFPFFEIPNWAVRLVVLFIVIGFPIALMLAWAFELTPEGLKRTEDADAAPTTAVRRKSHGWVFVVIIGALFSVGLFFLGRYGFRSAGSSTSDVPSKSIAVLPFDNLSRDPDNAFFAEGVQDEILTRLAKVADLKVISRTSTQKFKSAPDNLPQIAKQLGVMHILEGSVQKSNDKVRVNVQLINAMTDAHLWAEIYDRKLTDIFTVESDIAKTIADTLQAKLTGDEKQMMAMQPTTDTVAYDLYHKGRSLWEKRSGDNIPKAIAFYEQAIEHDPNYAPAYAGLANAYALLPFYTGTPRNASLEKAKETALKALSLESRLAEAHAALGKVDYFQLDVAGAIQEYQRAIELRPNYATAHQWYGNDALISFGRFDEAIAEGKRAVELDPLSPVINADLGITMYLARRYDDSLKQLKKALAIDPTFFYTHYSIGIVLQLKGDLKGAIAEYEKAKQLSSNDSFVIALLGSAKGLAGDKEAAEQTLKELGQIKLSQEVDEYSRALVYLGLGNKEEALNALERTYAARDGSSLCWIKVDPLLDPLHGDPRFEALVQKVIAPKAP
jgi:TolB-like protein/tetratricopeptide (TPR) repeat protein